MAEDLVKPLNDDGIMPLATETPDPRTVLHFKTRAKFLEKLNSGRVDPNKHFVVIHDSQQFWVRGAYISDGVKLDGITDIYNDWSITLTNGSTLTITLKGQQWNATTRTWDYIEKPLVINSATGSIAGLMSAVDKTEHDRIETANFGLTGITTSATTATINTLRLNINTNVSGNTDQTIPAATQEKAGVQTAADKLKEDRITKTNHTISQSSITSTSRTIKLTAINPADNSDASSDTTLPSADLTNAGLMSATDKKAIDNLHAMSWSHIKDGGAFTATTTDVSLNYECRSSTNDSSADPSVHAEAIGAASATRAGVMIAQDKIELDRVTTANYGLTTPTHNTGNVVLNSSRLNINTNATDTSNSQTINGATASAAGVMTTAQYAQIYTTLPNADTALDNAKVNRVGDTMTGTLTFSDNGYAADGVRPNSIPSTVKGVSGVMAGNDNWFIFGYGTASDSGYMEIATSDNGTEPIYVRQYASSAGSGGGIHEITLMDAAGNQKFNNITCGTINSGNVTCGTISSGAITSSSNISAAGYVEGKATYSITLGMPWGVYGDGQYGGKLFQNGVAWRSQSVTNDAGGIYVGKWAGSAETESAGQGYMEIWTGDDGIEPIFVRLYSLNISTNNSIKNEITLMDISGNQKFNVVTGSRFISTVGTGTAPLTVNSTTVVGNLNADLLDGYHRSNLYQGISDWMKATTGLYSTIDLSTYDQNTYYPVTGTALPYDGLHLVKLSVQLNSGSKPTWSTHQNGFSVNLCVLATAGGWGTTGALSIILDHTEGWTNSTIAAFRQLSNSSTPVLWLRGGGKYFVYTDYACTWTPRTTSYTISSETVAPTTTVPTDTITRATILANLSGTATNANQLGGVNAANYARLDVTTQLDFKGYGNFTAGAGNSSDIRFKTNISKLDDVLDKVNKLDIFNYTWNKEGDPIIDTFGVSAQQLEELGFNKIVHENDDEEKTKSVQYSHLGVIALKAIQELTGIIKEQLILIDELKNQILL